MSDYIHLLPDSVANQIAAGEVIQRPASVVKELVENAIDAGASVVRILLVDYGRTCIQVIDDGRGMTETDARMAFERHATSKIQQASDLFSLATFGFRGEALPSIAAIAEVELHTRTEDDELGSVIVIQGSKVVSQEVEMCPKGCNFLVKNLFYNVPARRKFLKQDQTELSNIVTEVERIALVNPGVSFILLNNGTELLNWQQTTRLQRIMQLFGKKANQQLLGIDVETSIARISGYVGTPDSARKKGCRQFFFVNGRYMRHPYFHKAVMEAFTRLIPEGEQVSYFIYFDVDPSRIDVNIHPTKTEIKFEDEHAIWQILAASVREVLGRSLAAPSIDFDTADKPDIPTFNPDSHVAPPRIDVNPQYNPFNAHHETPYRRTAIDWERLYGTTSSGGGKREEATLNPPDSEDVPASSSGQKIAPSNGSSEAEHTSPATTESAGKSMLFDENETRPQTTFQCSQYDGRFIVTSDGSGLILIQQHRAHVRILYERYMRQFEDHRALSQGMLFPELLQLAPSEAVQMDTLLTDFAHLGFDISNMGGGTFSIQGIPSGVEGLDPCELVRNMLVSAIEKNNDVRNEARHNMALTMARSAAVVDGQILTGEEMSAIVTDLLACAMPNYTPDGKKTLCMLSETDITKMFS